MGTNKLIVEFDADKIEKLQEWKAKQGIEHGSIKQAIQKLILSDLEKILKEENNDYN